MPQCLRLGARATILMCAITRYFRWLHKRWRHYVQGLPLVLSNAPAFADSYRPASDGELYIRSGIRNGSRPRR
jgi:hypothetical protein